MTTIEQQAIIREYEAFLSNKEFPCVAAKAAMARQHIECMVADHMACPKDDVAILQFLYNFVDMYRGAEGSFYSAAVIFTGPTTVTENLFDQFLWQRLQALHNLDNRTYAFDKRVGNDPSAARFSFSLKEEAFFIIGLHPASSRPARRFRYPALAFNPHAQFEKLRQANQYEKMKRVVRQRDESFSGNINPMLADFGDASEVYQYSGQVYDNNWQCPLTIHHGTTNNNSTP
jgi:uncharacterized protein